MREFFKKIVFGTVAVLLSTSAYADDNFTKQVIEPVVQISRNCSAVVIDVEPITSTYLVTADHCVEGNKGTNKSGYITVDVKERQKVIETKQYVFDVILRDTKQDLAVLKIRKEGLMMAGAKIAQTDPVEGDAVWAVGYPLGLTRTVTQGFFGGFESVDSKLMFDEFGNERALYRATPPIFGGNSGGGLFRKNGDNYEFVGVSDVVFPSFFVAGYYVPQDAINDIVERALKKEIKVETPKVVRANEKE